MAYPTLFSPVLNWNIEYNGYKFGPRSKVMAAVRPNHDMSGRVEISKTYIFRVSSYIVPRRPIPGDTAAVGIQIPEPLNKNVPFPGIDPFMAIATTDSEMKILLCRLTEQGKTFRYTGQGLGDIYVNTINPNTKQFVQDLDFGPKCKINTLRPVGFNKAWYIEWEIETTIMSCCGDEVIDFSNPARRIQEFNYSVNYIVDANGIQRRTISGTLKIIPPIYRGKNDLDKLGEYQDVVSDNARGKQAEYDALLALIDARKNIIDDINTNIALLNTQIDEILAGAELPLPQETSDLIDRLLNDRDDDQARLALEIDNQNLDVQKANALFDIINSLKKVDIGVHTSPAEDFTFPSFPEGFDRRLTFGPLDNDNVGNVRLYETVDQYVNIIEERIRIPFGFRRVHRNFDIHPNKRDLRFTLVDTEDRWHFSFVPGYSDVQISQHTRSVKSLFAWASTITGKFTFPKFLNVPKGVNFSDTGYSKIDFDSQEFEKIIPNKTVAIVDFMKVVNQRFALALVAMSHLRTIDAMPIVAANQQALKERRLNKYGIFPIAFSIEEDITGPDIAFSITYTVTGPLTKILQLSGHGLPCIIGSDLDATESLKKAQQAISRLQGNVAPDLKSTLNYANVIFFSNYTNIKKHEDWLTSQKYGSNSSKGGMPLVLDRTYDKILNICHIDSNKSVTDNIAKYDFIRPISNKDQLVQNFQNKIIVNEQNWFPDYQKGDDKTPEEQAIQNAQEASLVESIKAFLKPIVPVHTFSYISEQIGTMRLISRGTFPEANLPGGGNFLDQTGKFLTASYEIANYPARIHRGIWDILSGNIGLDTDIMLEDNKNSIFSILDDTLRTNSAGTDSYITMPTGFTFTDDDVFAFQRPLEDDIFIEINNMMSNIRPENSWILYESEIEIVTENHRVRHKLLPKQDMAPRSGSSVAPTLIENNSMLVQLTGGDCLVGESAISLNFLENYPKDDIIQTVGSPSTKIILRGRALRALYQIVPPALMTLGGQKANQTVSKIRSKYVDSIHVPVFQCEWEREYILANTPIGEIAVPENPLFIDPEFISDYDLNIKDFDRYVLQDDLALDIEDSHNSQLTSITRGS